jgi:hypothetical protein
VETSNLTTCLFFVFLAYNNPECSDFIFQVF